MTDTVKPVGGQSVEEQLRRVIQISPGNASLHGRLAELLLAEGRLAEAYDGYSEAARLEPREPAYRYALARASLALGRFAEAEAHFAWAAQLDPDDPAMQLGLGEAALAREHPELAAPHFRRAIELSDSAPAVRERAQALLLQSTRASADLAGQGWTGMLKRALFYGALATMSLGGVAIALPVAEALFLMVVIAPVAALARRR